MSLPANPATIIDRIESQAARNGVTAREWRTIRVACNGTPAELARRVQDRYGWDPRQCDGSAHLVALADMFLAAFLYIATASSAYDASHIRGSEGAAVVDVESRWAQMFDWIDRMGARAAA